MGKITHSGRVLTSGFKRIYRYIAIPIQEEEEAPMTTIFKRRCNDLIHRSIMIWIFCFNLVTPIFFVPSTIPRSFLLQFSIFFLSKKL